MIKFKDKELTCCSCGEKFVFTAGEEEFYLKKAFVLPKRCQACRKKNKKGIRKRRRDLVKSLRVEDNVKVEDKESTEEKKTQNDYHKQQEVKELKQGKSKKQIKIDKGK